MALDPSELDRLVPPAGEPFHALLSDAALHPLTLADRWTVSGEPCERYRHGDGDKIPLNIASVYRGEAFGARLGDEDAVTDIAGLHTAFGGLPPNMATFWNVDEFACLLLDIEAHADPVMLAESASYPALYAESSLSGVGRHLILPLDSVDEDLTALRMVKTLRSPDGDWEVHLRHWVTFTGNDVPVCATEFGAAAWRAHFSKMMRGRTGVTGPWAGDAHDVSLDLAALVARPPAYMVDVLSSFRRMCNRPCKRPDDFAYKRRPAGKGLYDVSRYEMSCMCHYAIQLIRDMEQGLFITSDDRIVRIRADEWADDALAYILYRAADAGALGFTHRDKHDTLRLGLPYLLYESIKAVEFARSVLARPVDGRERG